MEHGSTQEPDELFSRTRGRQDSLGGRKICPVLAGRDSGQSGREKTFVRCKWLSVFAVRRVGVRVGDGSVCEVARWLQGAEMIVGPRRRLRRRRLGRKDRTSIGKMDMSNVMDAASSASELQMNFMKLLVTQLQNQNPLEPMNNQDMSAQLAQFSQLEQLESMNHSFGEVLESMQQGYASNLIGKDISFTTQGDDGSQQTETGAVEEVVLDGGVVELIVGGHNLRLTDVLSVRE
jgi:flagellar basal-body rod modification protein FlgD